jgi:hypothetical protein
MDDKEFIIYLCYHILNKNLPDINVIYEELIKRGIDPVDIEFFGKEYKDE